MTRLFGVLTMVLLLAPAPAPASDLTLGDVIDLHRSGLGEDLLIAAIEADAGSLTLSFADIQDLKSDGVSERVIAALIRTGTRLRTGDLPAPPVQVIQEVVVYAPTVVVAREPDGPNHRPRRNGTQRRPASSEPPPATWVTRREDGKNVGASGGERSVPAATWVTPRDPKPRAPRPDGP